MTAADHEVVTVIAVGAAAVTAIGTVVGVPGVAIIVVRGQGIVDVPETEEIAIETVTVIVVERPGIDVNGLQTNLKLHRYRIFFWTCSRTRTSMQPHAILPIY